MKDFIELRRIFAILRAQRWLLLAATILAALIGLLISRSQTPVYQATTTMLVGEFMQSANVDRADIQTSTEVAKTYADIALRQPVLNKVVETLKLGVAWQGLKKQVQVKVVEGTQLIEVTAEATSPDIARAIADELAKQLIAISPTTMENTETDTNYSFVREQLESLKQRLIDAQKRMKEVEAAIAASTTKAELGPLEAERSELESSMTEWVSNYVSLADLARQAGTSTNFLTVIEPAQSTRDPVRPRIPLDTIIAGGVGLVLALGLAFLRDYLDYSIRSANEMEEFLGLAPLALVGSMQRSRWPNWRIFRKGRSWKSQRADGVSKGATRTNRGLVTLEQPDSPQSESFRRLRTNIQFASVAKPLRSFVVTSATSKEGKTFVAANLAVTLAQSGKTVVLVDADLRRPALHAVFGLPNSSGLTSLILSGHIAGAFNRIPGVSNLVVITSGPLPPNPSEILNSERFQQVMSQLAEPADLVIYDTPPVGLVTDPAILGARVDAVILVARARTTRRDLILSAKQALQNVGVKLILPVLNGVVLDGKSTYPGYYGHNQTRETELETIPLREDNKQPDTSPSKAGRGNEPPVSNGKVGASGPVETAVGGPRNY